MFYLFNTLIYVSLKIVDGLFGFLYLETGIGVLSSIYSLATFLPSLAVFVRRLHDTNRSGWWALISLIPLIGAIVLFVFLCLDGTPSDNKYGANPKA